MDQPKLERMLRLMKLLTANVEYSVDDLAERLSMSRRTIYRYIDTFREAGFVVKKRGNFIRLDKASPHFKDISQLVHFTEEEAVILRRAIESIDDTNTLKLNLKRKLYSVYDSRTLADTIVKGHNATNVHALIDAIENQQCVVLRNYQSSHATSDRKVEPFALTTNYIGVWCYDHTKGDCRLFKTARIDRVEATNESWSHQSLHKAQFTDIFRFNCDDNHKQHVTLRLGPLAHNLLLEEYPLAERDITTDSNGRITLSTDIADMRGVGRFVIGLLDDIEIIDSPELVEYIRNYINKNLK